MRNAVTQMTGASSHLAANLLGVEGIAALTLVHIHQFASGILHSSWRGVDPHEYTHIEVHAQGQHGNNVALISVSMPLQQSATQAGRHSVSHNPMQASQ